MNETTRALLVASHAGDAQYALNMHLGEMFIWIMIAIIMLIGITWGIKFLFNIFYTIISEKNEKTG